MEGSGRQREENGERERVRNVRERKLPIHHLG